MNNKKLNKCLLLAMIFVVGIALGLIIAHDTQYANAHAYAEEFVSEQCKDSSNFLIVNNKEDDMQNILNNFNEEYYK